MTDVVVLGWDGLDLELVDEFDLGPSFGRYRRTIETYANPVVGDPHTLELWPSMITGLHPDVHGILAKTEGEGVNWGNPAINLAATIGNSFVPDNVLTAIGAKLRRRGFGLDTKTPAYYRENGLETVFDEVPGRAISIPNYQTQYDREHELDAHRTDLWSTLDCEKMAGGGKEPTVALPRVYGLLGAELGERVGHTLEAIEAREPLVWTWFGLIDSIGHMEPALGKEVVEHWYRTAASVTRQVRELTPDETTVVAVSDHGIQHGEHTHYATIASDDPAPIDDVSHVFDLADWVRSQEYRARDRDRELEDADREAVRENLAQLGYIES